MKFAGPAFLLVAILSAAACVGQRPSAPAAAEAPCLVEPTGPAERILLVSEAEAARAAGRREVTEFVLATRSPAAVRLQLKSIGCSCYQVRHDRRALRVGDEVLIAANSKTRLQITAEPATEPGVREHRAELVGLRSDGTPFALTMTQSIRTLSDVIVRPDVLQLDVGAPTRSSKSGLTVQLEQVVRARDPAGIEMAWEAIPSGITASAPVVTAPPSRLGQDLWRIRRQATIAAAQGAETEPVWERPLSLSVVSRRDGVEFARSDVAVIARRRSGIVAPPLVHLGRVPPESTVSRRVQLRAVDSHVFTVLSASSREGTVEPVILSAASALEQWIEIRASGRSAAISDELIIETDHPVTRQLRFPVRSQREFSGGSQ